MNGEAAVGNTLLSKLTEITTNQDTMIAKLDKLSKLDKLDGITSGRNGSPSAMTSAVANKVGGKKGELIEFIGGPLKESFLSLKNSIVDLASKAMTLSDVFATANAISSLGQVADMTHIDFQRFTQFVNALKRDGSSEGGALSAVKHLSSMNYGLTVDLAKLEMSDKQALDFFKKSSPDLVKQTIKGDDGTERLINTVERFFMLQKAVHQARQNIDKQRETGQITAVEAEKQRQLVDYNVAQLARNDAAIISSINNYKTEAEKAEIRAKLPKSEQGAPIDLQDKVVDERNNAEYVDNSRRSADRVADALARHNNNDNANKALVVQKMEPRLSKEFSWINNRFRNNQDAIAEARKDAVYLQVIDDAASKIIGFLENLGNFLVHLSAFVKWNHKDPPDDPPDSEGGAPELVEEKAPQTPPVPANDNATQTSPVPTNDNVPQKTLKTSDEESYFPGFWTMFASMQMGPVEQQRFLHQDRIRHDDSLSKEQKHEQIKQSDVEFDQISAQIAKMQGDFLMIQAGIAATVLTEGVAGEYFGPVLAARTASLMANIGKVGVAAAGTAMVAQVATTPEAHANSLVMLHKGDASGQNIGYQSPCICGADGITNIAK